MDADQLTCFVIMPFGLKDDAIRGDKVDFDAVYVDLIEAAVQEVRNRGIRLQCVRADKIEKSGLIHEQMIQMIADADVAVVDLTTANANVFYELGVRHALRDRVTVLLRRAGSGGLPFNLAGMKSIGYDVDEQSLASARFAIADFIVNGLRSGDKDSLVYTVLPGLRAGRDPRPVDDDVEEYGLEELPGKRIGIVCGDLRNVNLGDKLEGRPIEVWVNSENVGMQMARQHEASISGLVRYLGAERDDTGTIVRDRIADGLAAKMKRRQLVNPGEVVSTSAGALERTHNVRRIFHVAAVYGIVGRGYRSIANVELCITNALARLDREARGSRSPARSILFPLLGTGTARAEITQNARTQIGAVVAYLRARAHRTAVERVYFLAPNEVLRAGLRVALAERQATALEVPHRGAKRQQRDGAAAISRSPGSRAAATAGPKRRAASRAGVRASR